MHDVPAMVRLRALAELGAFHSTQNATNETSDNPVIETINPGLLFLRGNMLRDDITTNGTSDPIRDMLGDDSTTNGTSDYLIRDILGDDITTNGASDPIRDMLGDDIITNRTSDHPIEGTTHGLGGDVPEDDITGGVPRPSHTVNSSRAKGGVKPFTPEDVKFITEKREEGKMDKEISEMFREAGKNRSASSIYNFRRRACCAKHKVLTPQELAALEELKTQQKLSWKEIAAKAIPNEVNYRGWTPRELTLLRELKMQNLPWKETAANFPGRL
ncbi:MAG: hypothetical protein M1840_001229 [Geoglossum simile]|nr:MAG: hypothetical protein M1840_001229 [Geoglossum simile]